MVLVQLLGNVFVIVVDWIGILRSLLAIEVSLRTFRTYNFNQAAFERRYRFLHSSKAPLLIDVTLRRTLDP